MRQIHPAETTGVPARTQDSDKEVLGSTSVRQEMEGGYDGGGIEAPIEAGQMR